MIISEDQNRKIGNFGGQLKIWELGVIMYMIFHSDGPIIDNRSVASFLPIYQFIDNETDNR